MSTAGSSAEIRFDGWTLLRPSGELLREGRRIRLQDHPLQVLDALLARPGEMVTREELIARLWPKQVVDFDTALNSAVRRLRAALGDDAETPRYIETIPRRGYRFIGALNRAPAARVAEPEPAPATDTTFRGRARGWLLAGAALAVFALLWWRVLDREEFRPTPVPASAGVPIVVVLPFVDLAAGEHSGLFADGLTEELINRLAQISGLRVIARGSAFAYRGQDVDVAKIARDLGVTHALEGSVRRSGDRLRVTAQLLDTGARTYLWSQDYDRRVDDILAIQDEIAERVAAALEVRFDPAAIVEYRPAARAYEAYLLGRHLFSRRGPGDVERARDYFRQAVEMDPEFARAWAGLASAWWILVADGLAPRDIGLAELERAANRALALDPRLAEPHIRLANRAWAMSDPATTRAHRSKAAELEPDSPLVIPILARQESAAGRPDEVIAMYRRLIELDPLSFVYRSNLSWELYADGQYERAIAEARKVIELNPQYSREIECLSLIRLDRFDEARTLAQTIPDRAVSLQCLAMAEHGLGHRAVSEAALAELVGWFDGKAALRIAELQAYRGDRSSAFDWLRRNREHCKDAAGFTGQCMGAEQARSPFLASLRSDPRWAESVDPR